MSTNFRKTSQTSSKDFQLSLSEKSVTVAVAGRFLCSFCSRPTNPKAPFRKCGKCGSAQYCDEDCQEKDWPAHQAQCDIFAERKDGFERVPTSRVMEYLAVCTPPVPLIELALKIPSKRRTRCFAYCTGVVEPYRCKIQDVRKQRKMTLLKLDAKKIGDELKTLRSNERFLVFLVQCNEGFSWHWQRLKSMQPVNDIDYSNVLIGGSSSPEVPRMSVPPLATESTESS